MKGQTMRSNFPSSSELYALEAAARRARSEEMARLFKVGARALKASISRAVLVFQTKGMRHA
jgi:hypothetical protein